MAPKPLIVPVFVPHAGCPHRCAFCNQRAITGKSAAAPDPRTIENQILTFLDGCRQESRPSQIAFFGGNFLGLAPALITTLLSTAARFVAEKRIDGIRFSTRPDTIDPERLELISEFPVRTMEIGAQSMDDRVLDLSRRGHTAADTVRAAGLVRGAGYELGLQIMVGLPGDDEDISMETARRVAALAPDFVRIYPTVVVAGSLLAGWYRDGTYRPWSLDRAVAHTANLAGFFKENGIRVIRMGLQATEDLQPGDSILAGPWHPAFGHLVYARMFLEKAEALLAARAAEMGSRGLSEVVLRVHPRAESRLRGEKNGNIRALRERFGLETLTIQRDAGLPEDELEVF
jgi:histone acetyltransferase (RNA polymerase elongator complex component)